MSSNRERLERAIARGGSVAHKGKHIFRAEDLPSEEELATPSGKLAIEARKREALEAAKAEGIAQANAAKKKKVVEEEDDD